MKAELERASYGRNPPLYDGPEGGPNKRASEEKKNSSRRGLPVKEGSRKVELNTNNLVEKELLIGAPGVIIKKVFGDHDVACTNRFPPSQIFSTVRCLGLHEMKRLTMPYH